MVILALVLPWLSFLLRRKWKSAILALVLQVLAIYSLFPFGVGIVLWLGISVWAVLDYNASKANNRRS